MESLLGLLLLLSEIGMRAGLWKNESDGLEEGAAKIGSGNLGVVLKLII